MFWEDPYLTVLDTTVLSQDGNTVILNDTIAYAEAGGQESDQVTINNIPVLESRLDPEKRFITYVLPEGHGLLEQKISPNAPTFCLWANFNPHESTVR